jgi:TIR domain
MAYLATFEEDVFISYATLDDKPLFGEAAGWVTQLHENLAARVAQRLGADNVRMWRDVELRGNDELNTKIMGRLSRTAAFLSILSPGFLKRGWTIRELEAFVQHAHRGSGLLVKGERSRIFKVEKLEVPREALPLLMQGTRSYKFFASDPGYPGVTRELWPRYDGPTYLKALDNLAYDIANLLREMDRPVATHDRVAVRALAVIAWAKYPKSFYYSEPTALGGSHGTSRKGRGRNDGG